MKKLINCILVLLFLFSATSYSQEVALTKEEKVVSSLATKVSLHYYYLSTCPYCGKQELALAKLRVRTGLTIIPFSLDGQPMKMRPNGKPIAFKDGRRFAMQYGIQETPTLLAFEPPNNYTLLSTGLLSYESLINYLVAYGEQRNLVGSQVSKP